MSSSSSCKSSPKVWPYTKDLFLLYLTGILQASDPSAAGSWDGSPGSSTVNPMDKTNKQTIAQGGSMKSVHVFETLWGDRISSVKGDACNP